VRNGPSSAGAPAAPASRRTSSAFRAG